MKFYNSLTKQVEDFKSINPGFVTMYCCGPTVYDYVTIANFRTFMVSDFLYRTLEFNNYKVHFVMNLTDVGHLTEDESSTEDKVERAAEKEGKTAKEITEFYTKQFLDDYSKLNLKSPIKFTKATEYIDEQIKLIATLEEKGYTYETSDGIYFDTSKFKNYGQLSGLSVENIKEGARVEANPEKKNPTDFALWKLSPQGVKRFQEWDSPWGRGFPGWHLECSAMSLAELGDTIDFHLGGEDLKMIHHQNEIAQSECATSKKFVNYWIHSAFLLFNNGKMSKSLGNVYTLSSLVEKGYDPMALRYLYMTAHYRTPLNFTWEALDNASNSVKRIYDIVSSYKHDPDAIVSDKYMSKFNEKISDDLNMPEAIATVWEMLKSGLSEGTKFSTIMKMDEVLGLKIEEHTGFELPDKVVNLAKMRSAYRKNGIWDKADVLRREINDMGYVVEDLDDDKFKIKRKI